MENTPGGSGHIPHLPHEPSEHLHPLAESGEPLEKLAHSLEDLSHQTHEADETKKKFIKALKIDAYAIPLITVLGVALSIGASTYWNSVQQKHNRIYGQISEIKEEIHQHFEVRNQLMNAMTQVRSIRDIGQIQCKDGKYMGNDKISYQEKLFSATFNFVSATYSTTGFFNKAIDKKISEFMSYIDLDTKGICEKGAVNDENLRPLQRDINNLILDDINVLKLKRNALIEQSKK